MTTTNTNGALTADLIVITVDHPVMIVEMITQTVMTVITITGDMLLFTEDSWLKYKMDHLALIVILLQTALTVAHLHQAQAAIHPALAVMIHPQVNLMPTSEESWSRSQKTKLAAAHQVTHQAVMTLLQAAIHQVVKILALRAATLLTKTLTSVESWPRSDKMIQPPQATTNQAAAHLAHQAATHPVAILQAVTHQIHPPQTHQSPQTLQTLILPQIPLTLNLITMMPN